VISGHCFYDFHPPDYYSPSWWLEMARPREMVKPNWFLPTWFTFASPTRAEHYLSLMNNIQGLMVPPDATVHRPSTPNPGGADQTAAIVETNKLAACLGTIFTQMPVARPPVAMLYSLSQNIYRQTRDMKHVGINDPHYNAMMYLYVAGKTIQNPFMPVLDEDVLDGTLAAHHRAVILGGIEHLDPAVIAGLEAFAENGGLVLVTADCTVQINRAVRLKAAAQHPKQAEIDKLYAEKKHGEAWRTLMLPSHVLKIIEPLTSEIRFYLDRNGIRPAFECDNPGIAASRQAEGDIEYLFAVNATYDSDLGTRNALRAATATIAIPADGRPVYDAVLGRPMPEFRKDGDRLKAELRFGPGQMRVFARTARPIGGVSVLQPAVINDSTIAQTPIRVQIGATLLDDGGRVLAGSAPLHIRIVDPLGATRYDLYRATKLGTLREDVQLAANDPAGEWRVIVRELLGGTEGSAAFAYRPAAQCGAIAGTGRRAVTFDLDREHIYRFFRTNRAVTIVRGTGDYNGPAAERLAKILEPWDVWCMVIDAAQAATVNELTDEQAKTWVGLDYAGTGAIKPGAGNPPQLAGFAIREPLILLGTPDDNALINFLSRYSFLPYKPVRDQFPGRGRSMIAWQRDGIAREQESVALIAYDADGMAEAVGSLYEMATGMEPLTPWRLPSRSSVVAASKAPAAPPPTEAAWQVELPDRVAAVKSTGRAAIVLALDGTLASVDAKGKIAWKTLLDTGHAWSGRMDASADGDLIVVGGRTALIGLNGKGKKLFEVPRPAPVGAGHAVPVVTFVAVSPDGKLIADGAADGTITVRNAKGEQLWAKPGWKADSQFFFQTAIFSADGKTLAALSDKQATVLRAADGAELAKIDGADCRFHPVRLGTNLLVSDGKQTVTVLSPVDGKVVGKMTSPGLTIAAAQTAVGCLAGTEEDGTVRLLKAVDGKAEDQAAWSYAAPRLIVKKIAAGPQIAVIYWGGTVHLLDHDGTVKAAVVFPQDVTDAAWLGDRLIVGTADGRIAGIDAKR